MTAPTAGPDEDRRRLSWRGAAAVGTGVLAIASIAAAFAIGGPAPSPALEDDTPAPVAEPAPEPLDLEAPTPAPVADDEEEVAEAAEVTVTQLVAATNQILQRADGGIEGIETIASGFVRGELEALAAERAEQGYKQVGEAEVTSVEIAESDLDADPATMTLEVCIDVSDVDVLDSNGRSLKDSLYNPGHPVLHRYGAEHLDGVWKLTTHEIPEDARCA